MPEAQPQKRKPELALPPVAAPVRLGHAALLAAIAAEEPTLSADSVRLLGAELVAETGGLPGDLESVGEWTRRMKLQCPICWPAVVAADPQRLASLLEFSQRPGRVSADTLREIMASLAELAA